MVVHLGRDLTDEDFHQPIASYNEGPCPRKSEKCPLCKKLVEKGAPSVWLRMFNWSSDLTLYFHEPCFRQSGFEENYRSRYLKNAYDMEDFVAPDLFFNSDYEDIVANFDLETAIGLITNPRFPKHKAYWDKDVAVELAGKGRDQGTPDARAPFILFDILYKCGYGPMLLKQMQTLPPHAQVMFALHDDRRFQQEAARLTGVPDLPEALERLRKSRVSLDDIQFVAETGRMNPVLSDAMSSAIDIYQLDRSYSAVSCGFSGFDMVRYTQLCYFFISDQCRLPVLYRLLTRTQFPTNGPGEFTYTKCFYYRAAVICLALMNQPMEIESWLKAMPGQVEFYPQGSPKGFINDTRRMVEQYISCRRSA